MDRYCDGVNMNQKRRVIANLSSEAITPERVGTSVLTEKKKMFKKGVRKAAKRTQKITRGKMKLTR